ncbi:MAG: HVO_2753 family zinc finger protein [Methanocellales archaeon]
MFMLHAIIFYEISMGENAMLKLNVEYCISCGVRLFGKGFTRFPCPNCGESLGRCAKCRQQSNQYICKKCGFLGP